MRKHVDSRLAWGYDVILQRQFKNLPEYLYAFVIRYNPLEVFYEAVDSVMVDIQFVVFCKLEEIFQEIICLSLSYFSKTAQSILVNGKSVANQCLEVSKRSKGFLEHFTVWAYEHE